MVIYTCPTCKKEFNKKYNFEMHTENKKKPCKQNSKIIQIIPNIPNVVATPKNDLLNTCEYCEKNFSTIFNLNKHLRYSCKVKKEEDDNKKNIFQLLIEKEKLLELQNNKIEIQQNEMNELKKQLNELSKTIKELTNKTISNNVNKGVINKGVINNITITTEQLSKFGKEDLNKISQQEFLKIRNCQGIGIFKECAKLIYNNKSFNRTVYVTDHSRKKAMIWDGKDWILSELDEVINIMREKIRDFYNLKLGDIEDERIIKDFETRIQKYFDMLYDEYADEKEDDKQFMERVKGLQNKFENELIIWLSNIKKDVIENYNNILQSILINNNKLIEQKKIVDIDTNTVQKINIPRKKGRPKKII